MKRIAIIGAGGFGREVEVLIEQINTVDQVWDFIGYYDDGKVAGETIGRKKVLGKVNEIQHLREELYVVIAVGDPMTKKNISEIIGINNNIKFPLLIHPNIQIGRNVVIGEGSIICAGNIMTVDILLGRHTILNLSCTVGHDTVMGDFCSVMPGVNISGEVVIKDCVYIGTGAKIINQITIMENVTIGSGAVVTKNLAAGITAVGVPAKPLISK
jgi:sugar O-acyltransferase (sialic acid O-acetyltransferase NeuD family)